MKKKTLQLKIVIIRHGEKPAKGNNLDCQGLNRALALPPVLNNACGGAPNYTYVPKLVLGKKTDSARMFQTVTPFAVQYNLYIDTNYTETATTALAKDILKKTGVVLVVWEHKNIPPLAQKLGVKGKLKWKGTDFDSIWTIEFPNGTATLTVTQEGLTPSPDCP